MPKAGDFEQIDNSTIFGNELEGKSNNVELSLNIDAGAVNALYTVPVGKVLRVSSISLNGCANANAAAFIRIRFTDSLVSGSGNQFYAHNMVGTTAITNMLPSYFHTPRIFNIVNGISVNTVLTAGSLSAIRATIHISGELIDL